ncbi:MAG: MFS transporter [Herminiimonas sp.]|nr:MFS transporter [Herminiimonas sp.]
MRTQLWSLTLGNFAIGTGALIVPGMLNELTADLHVSAAAVGMLISAFALTVCIGGPFLASWTTAIERRKLLTAALVLYAVAHVAAAFVPGYESLLAVRVVTAIGAAIFTAQAAATAGLIVPPDQRGKAIGLVFLGWSIAAVVGVPLGAYLGAHIGWRLTIALVGAMSALLAVWVWIQIPPRLFVAPMDRAAWQSLFGNRPLLLAIASTALQAIGQFTIFSYMARVLKDFIAASPTTISLMFLCFGMTGVLGNVIGTRVMDRVGAARVSLVAMGCMATALVFWPLTRDSLAVTVAMILLWGLGCFAVNSAQQTRLVGLAPNLASASVALNSSALYFGQALGAFIGGIIITAEGTSRLSIIGAVLVVIAMAVSHLAASMSSRALCVKPA